MRFSVIVTAHNLEGYIKRAIQSIVEQSFTDYEVLVICDACTDDTVNIVREQGIEPVLTEYKAPGLARNAGLDAATGEYVLFLDGDDRFLHTEAFAMIDIALKGALCDILNFGFIYGENGYVSARHPSGGFWINVWSHAWRRDFIGAERFNAERYAEDEDFCKRMFRKNPRTGEWNTPFVYYTYPRMGSLSEEAENK